MPARPSGASERVQEYNFIPDARNALQRLPEGAFLYLLKEVMNWRRISDTQKLL